MGTPRPLFRPLPMFSPWMAFGLGALYFVACALSSLMIYGEDSVALFWPAAGVALIGLLCFGMRHFWFIPLALLVYHATLSPIPDTFLPFSLAANTLSALAGVWFIQRRTEPGLDIRSGFRVFFGGVLLAAVSATIGVAGMHVSDMLPAAGLAGAWIHWALGSVLGVAAVGPAMLLTALSATAPSNAAPDGDYGREPERLAWLVALAASFLLMAWGATAGGPYVLGLAALPLAALTWSAIRFAPWWTAMGTMVTSLLIGIFAGFGLAGFSVPTRALDAVQLLGFLILLAVLPVVVATAAHERRRVTRRMLRNATTDPITGLPNRSAFEHAARRRLEQSGGPPRALVYLDLDHLKLVNDTASHAAGDRLIRGIAGVLQAAVRPHDVIGHLGADEFAVLMHNVLPAAAEDRARQWLRDIAGYRCDWEGRMLGTTASIGLVPISNEETDFARLFSQADAACFTAKELGGNQVSRASLDAGRELDHTQSMRDALRAREAIEQRSLVLYSQAIVPLHDDGAPHGRHFELLLRLRDPATGELLLPSQFLPAAGRYRLGVRIDREVIQMGLDWLERHADPREVELCSINLSAESLADEDFMAFLGDRLRRSSFPPDKLCFEVTETSALRDIGRAQRFIMQMRELGCRFALDDFGTGFCSFGYVRALDVDYFKIDGSFVRELDTSPLSLPIVRAITDIAHTLDKRSIAEHTENDAQLVTLARLGVDMAQGFGVHRPEPIEHYFARAQPSAMPVPVPAPESVATRH
jgi:diguanylate cyclase (GGDEF)-like protein